MAAGNHHDHGHGDHDHHDHGHGGGHSHAPANFDRAFAIGTVLNAGFVAVQIGFGLAAHSAALIADAVHNLGDVAGLLIAWGAMVLGRRHPTPQRTYGWGRGSIMASLVNAITLLLGCGAIALQAIHLLANPVPVNGATMGWVAATGILINGATALMFMRGRHQDLNLRGAFLHMAADAAISAGVLVAGLLIGITGWLWLDPITSLAIAVLVVAGTWSLLRDSVNLALDAVPAGLDHAEVSRRLHALPGVTEVHDLHIWGLSTSATALTAHLVAEAAQGDLIPLACHEMRQRFGIGHCTFQIETAALASGCALREPHTV